MQIQPEIHNEYGRLLSVVVGVARRMGGAPELEDCYDARSYESVLLKNYPSEEDCMVQMKGLIFTYSLMLQHKTHSKCWKE